MYKAWGGSSGFGASGHIEYIPPKDVPRRYDRAQVHSTEFMDPQTKETAALGPTVFALISGLIGNNPNRFRVPKQFLEH